MQNGKKKLAKLWFCGAGFLFLILFIQTFMNHYGEDVNEAWGWMVTNVIPTLSLIIGVLAADALDKRAKTDIVDTFLFKLTFGLSLIYLLAIVFHVLFQPFSPTEPLKMMRMSNLWLGPFQGLVSASLGVFFVSKPKNK